MAQILHLYLSSYKYICKKQNSDRPERKQNLLRNGQRCRKLHLNDAVDIEILTKISVMNAISLHSEFTNVFLFWSIYNRSSLCGEPQLIPLSLLTLR